MGRALKFEKVKYVSSADADIDDVCKQKKQSHSKPEKIRESVELRVNAAERQNDRNVTIEPGI